MDILPPICQKTLIRVAPDTVYDALVSEDAWNAWFTRETTMDTRVGGEIVFRWREWGPDRVTMDARAEISLLEPKRRFGFIWFVDSYRTQVEFLVEPHPQGTKLTVTESGYPVSAAEDCLECASGWGEAATLLKFWLEGQGIY